jgi:hypothetical protein
MIVRPAHGASVLIQHLPHGGNTGGVLTWTCHAQQNPMRYQFLSEKRGLHRLNIRDGRQSRQGRTYLTRLRCVALIWGSAADLRTGFQKGEIHRRRNRNRVAAWQPHTAILARIMDAACVRTPDWGAAKIAGAARELPTSRVVCQLCHHP